MRLRAQIVVDIDAGDYVEAAEHQSLLQQYLKEIQLRYPDASLTMRERRERRDGLRDGLAVSVPGAAPGR
jgi:hypothetical protein